MVKENATKKLYLLYFLLPWSGKCEKLSFQTTRRHVDQHRMEVGMASTVQGKDIWQETLEHALEGDVQQLGHLCQDYLRPKLYSFALSLLKNQTDAEDVVQDAFVSLLTHYQQIRKRELASFESFVTTMVRNLCRDLWKKKKPTELESDNRATSTAPHKEIDRQNLLIALCFEVQQNLTESEQQLFEMKVMQELTYDTISESTGIAVTTLHHHYQGILRKLDTQVGLREYWKKIKGK